MPSYTYKVLPEYIGGFGRLTATGLTRFLQRAATDHTDELGYTSDWYRKHERAWMARRHRIDVKNSVGPGKSVRVETEVEDFKRVRSLRGYRVYAEDTEELVARAFTDWVYLDRSSNRPCRVPDSMIEQFEPVYDGASPNRGNFNSPEQLESTTEVSFETQFRDLDELAHVNNVVYLEYLQETILRSYGVSSERSLKDVPSSFRFSDLTIQYVGQAKWGDRITCRVNSSETDPDQMDFVFAIAHHDERIVEGRGTWTV